MKCKLCGHRTTSLTAMNAHYRKAHPGRPKKPRVSSRQHDMTAPGGIESGRVYPPRGQENEIIAEIEELSSRLSRLMHELRTVRAMGL